MRYVYVLKCGVDTYKIGIAENVTKRVRGMKTSNAKPIHVVAVRLVENAKSVERSLHDYLKDRHLDGGTEWFHLTNEELIDVLILLNKEKEVGNLSELVKIKSYLESQVEDYKSILKELKTLNKYAKLQLAKKMKQENRTVIERAYSPKAFMPEKDNDEQVTEKAIHVVIAKQRASTSLLQRELKIGYSRASRIIHELERRGIVGPDNGAKARNVLVELAG